MRDSGPDNENAFDRFDRKLGMAWSRIGGSFIGLLGLAALMAALASEDWLQAWPLWLAALGLIAVARLCFRSRAPMTELLDESPGPRRKRQED